MKHQRRELSLRPTLRQAQGKDGIRVKKTAGSSNLYYPFTHYEIAGSTVTKYYFPSTSSGQASPASESP